MASPYAKYNTSQKCNMDLSTSVLDGFRMILKWFIDRDDLINLIHEELKDVVLKEIIDVLDFNGNLLFCSCKKLDCDVGCCMRLDNLFCIDCHQFIPLNDILGFIGLSLNGTVCEFFKNSLLKPIVYGLYDIELSPEQEISLIYC